MTHRLLARPLIALATVTVAVLLFAACGGSSDATPQPSPTTAPAAPSTPAPSPSAVATPEGPPPITITSSGGSAAGGGGGEISVSIPPSALPAGVSPSDVTIESIGADDLVTPIEDAEVVAAYRLLPDGLVLSEPATVSVQVPVTGLSGDLLLIHLTEEGLSPIDDLTVTIDDAGEVATLEATITHFSDLSVAEARFFEIGLDLFETVYKVGESFPVSVVVRSTGRGWGLREFKDGIVTVKVAEPIILSGFWTGKAPALLPNLVDERPSISGLEAGGYTNTQLFTCAEESSGVSVVYRGNLAYFIEQQFLGDDGSRAARNIPGGGGEIAIFEQESITCVLVPPIEAKYDGDFTTTYSIDVDPDAGYRFVWSGPNCGSVSGTGQRVMVWVHRDEDNQDKVCEHAREAHKGTIISVLVVAGRTAASGAAPGMAPPPAPATSARSRSSGGAHGGSASAMGRRLGRSLGL